MTPANGMIGMPGNSATLYNQGNVHSPAMDVNAPNPAISSQRFIDPVTNTNNLTNPISVPYEVNGSNNFNGFSGVNDVNGVQSYGVNHTAPGYSGNTVVTEPRDNFFDGNRFDKHYNGVQANNFGDRVVEEHHVTCLLYTSPSPRDS